MNDGNKFCSNVMVDDLIAGGDAEFYTLSASDLDALYDEMYRDDEKEDSPWVKYNECE